MDNEYKLVVVGEGGVGKSALTLQLFYHKFVERCDPTAVDSYRQLMEIDEEACLLNILDTAGQEDCSVIQDLYMRTGQGFLCVYDITSRSSYEQLASFRKQILLVQEKEHIPMVLVGNKCDLEHVRQVSTSEVADLANSFGCKFFESSAKSRINVEESFFELVREVRKTMNRAGGGMNKVQENDNKANNSNKRCLLF